jgi:glutaminyl-tRNA synthetase
MADSQAQTAAQPVDFIRSIVDEDVAAGRHGGRVATRFPPEPNGYLHFGHAKSICLNFGVAEEHGGTCNLRFDDTNPTKEDVEYVDAIKADVAWLGFQWTELLFASITSSGYTSTPSVDQQGGAAWTASRPTKCSHRGR